MNRGHARVKASRETLNPCWTMLKWVTDKSRIEALGEANWADLVEIKIPCSDVGVLPAPTD